MGAVHIRVRHDDDAAVTKPCHVERPFVFAIALFFRFADPGADRGNHRPDLGVFEKLVFARFLYVDKFTADWQDRLVASIASLFRRAAR